VKFIRDFELQQINVTRCKLRLPYKAASNGIPFGATQRRSVRESGIGLFFIIKGAIE